MKLFFRLFATAAALFAALFLANVLTGLIHNLFLPSCTGLASPECNVIDRTQLWLMTTGTGIILVSLLVVMIRRLRSRGEKWNSV